MLSIFSGFVFIFLRALSVVFPPLPGFVFDIIGVSVFGKWAGLFLAEIGVMLGACLAFFIAKKYREDLVKKFVPLSKLNKWVARIPIEKQFFGLLVLRLLTSPAFDFVNYAAGLTKIRFSTFFWASFLGSLPSMFLFYYFGELTNQRGIIYFLSFIAVFLLALWLFTRKVAK